MVKVLRVDANAIRNIMVHDVNIPMSVWAMKIAVSKANALIYKVQRCHDVNATVILAGLDKAAQKVSKFICN